jgi:hypothetical protein
MAERPVHERTLPGGTRDGAIRAVSSPSIRLPDAAAMCPPDGIVHAQNEKSRAADAAPSLHGSPWRPTALRAIATSCIGTRLPDRKVTPSRLVSTAAARH